MATLQALLSSPDQSVRLKAALGAGTYPNPDFIEILLSQCSHEPDFFVRDTLSWALMRHDREAVVQRLITELKSPFPQARSQAVHTLSKIGDKKNYPLITDELLFDVPNDELELVESKIKYLMENSMPLSIPVVVESGTGNNWLEAH